MGYAHGKSAKPKRKNCKVRSWGTEPLGQGGPPTTHERKNMRTRLNHKEAQTAQWIGTPFVLLFIILIKLLWKTKRWLSIFLLASFVMYGFSNIGVSAISPRANLSQPIVVAPSPTSEQQQIKDYIIQVFGEDAPDAFKILACENHSLNPLATGHNTNGTYDRGIFQLNDIHGIPSQYAYDWHVNIDIAYHIFKEQGWRPWACESVYHALERSDTL